MCIRDRVWIAIPGSLGAMLSDGDYGAQRVVALIPVSYTHLRAHETVLDLVCRLLLEKKITHKLKNILVF